MTETRKPEPGVMHTRPACGCREVPYWEIQPVREWPDYHGGTEFVACDDADSIADDNDEAIGPVLFGVYLRHRWPDAASDCIVATHVRDFGTYEAAIEFLDSVAPA